MSVRATTASKPSISRYKIRHCQTGKPQRSQIHANRLKLCNEDRDIFYAKNKIVSEGVSDDQPSQRDADAQNTDDELDEGWYEIKKLSSRKVTNGKETYLVHWADGTTSREPADNITDYAKSQYFVAQDERRRKRRR